MIEFVTASRLTIQPPDGPPTVHSHLNSKFLRLIRQGVYDHPLFFVKSAHIYTVDMPQDLLRYLKAAFKDCSLIYFKGEVRQAQAVEAAKRGHVPAHAAIGYTDLTSHLVDAYNDVEYGQVVRATWGVKPPLDAVERIGRDYSAWIKARDKAQLDLILSNKGCTEVYWQSLDGKSEVVKLLDQAALTYEGYVMSHCVGRYYGKIIGSETQYILSLRVGGKSVATAEYDAYGMVQCKAKYNGAVPGPDYTLMQQMGVQTQKKRYSLHPRVELGALEGMRFVEDAVLPTQNYPLYAYEEQAVRRIRRQGMNLMQVPRNLSPDLENQMLRTGGRLGHAMTSFLQDFGTPLGVFRPMTDTRSPQQILVMETETEYGRAKMFQLAVSYQSLNVVDALKAVALLYENYRDVCAPSDIASFLEPYLGYGKLDTVFPRLVIDLLDPTSKFNVAAVQIRHIDSFNFPCEDRTIRQHQTPFELHPWYVKKAVLEDLLKADFKPKQAVFSVPGYLGLTPSLAQDNELDEDNVNEFVEFIPRDTYSELIAR